MKIKPTLKAIKDLTRINRPTGIWLLFFPSLFAILLSEKFNPDYDLAFITSFFFIGAVLMRSAGCVINDIADRKFDKKVRRTKSRPIASERINIFVAIAVLLVLLGAGLAILLNFNRFTISLGFIAALLVAIYPFTKRFTDYPQVFLGVTFNFGVLMASAQINNTITVPIIFLYLSTIVWTVIYDTIYAYQDVEDDIKAGVRSSAISFGPQPQKILYSLAVTQILLLAAVGYTANLKAGYYLFIYIALFHLLCQIKTCNFSNPKNCLDKFRSNTMAALIILMAILIG